MFISRKKKKKNPDFNLNPHSITVTCYLLYYRKKNSNLKTSARRLFRSDLLNLILWNCSSPPSPFDEHSLRTFSWNHIPRVWHGAPGQTPVPIQRITSVPPRKTSVSIADDHSSPSSTAAHKGLQFRPCHVTLSLCSLPRHMPASTAMNCLENNSAKRRSRQEPARLLPDDCCAPQ